jgi:hypothetical protein
MKGFKGFDKNLKCRDKQYEIGQTFEEGEADLCRRGLHFCEYPLDCFGYYPPSESRFAEIEAEEVSDKKGDSSKRVAKKITVKGELSLRGLIEAAVKFTFDMAEWKDDDKATGDQGAASATGNRGAASATGYQGAASATGDQGAASATGDQGAASVRGENSVAMATGIEGKAAGALGCWIVLADWVQEKNGYWRIKRVKSVKVDGKKIKPDTFYCLCDGKFVEVEG